MPLTLGERIKQFRFKRGMTQEALAASAGITKASVSNYERDIRNPQYNVLEDIARALSVPVSELLVQAPKEVEDGDKYVRRQPYNKRSRRLEKMIAAFNQLSDEAQLKAIERVEELILIPEYQRPLPSTLQQYIYNEYNLVYEPINNEKSRQVYTVPPFSDGDPLIVDAEHIVLDQQTLYPEEEAAHWDFFYYSSGSTLAEYPVIVEQFLKEITYPVRYKDDLSFVFDDESTLDAFFTCFARLLESGEATDIRPGFHGMATLFVLIDKRTGGIKDVKRSEPGSDRQMLPGILQQYISEEYSFSCRLIKDSAYRIDSFSDEYPLPLEVRRMVLQQEGPGQWEFLYYCGERPLNDVFAAVNILKGLTYPVESKEHLSFIFDNTETSSTFHTAFLALLARSPKIDPGFLELDTLFILIDKKTGGIKNIDIVGAEFKKTCRDKEVKPKVESYDQNGKTHLVQFDQWNRQ